MLTTEDEAREKLCPFAGLANLIVHTLDDAMENYCCKGSGCMMWCWFDGGIVEHGACLSGGKRLGYCGLAGKPE